MLFEKFFFFFFNIIIKVPYISNCDVKHPAGATQYQVKMKNDGVSGLPWQTLRLSDNTPDCIKSHQCRCPRSKSNMEFNEIPS